MFIVLSEKPEVLFCNPFGYEIAYPSGKFVVGRFGRDVNDVSPAFLGEIVFASRERAAAYAEKMNKAEE